MQEGRKAFTVSVAVETNRLSTVTVLCALSKDLIQTEEMLVVYALSTSYNFIKSIYANLSVKEVASYLPSVSNVCIIYIYGIFIICILPDIYREKL